MNQLQSLSAAEQQTIISTAEIAVSRYAKYLMDKNHIPNLFSKEDLEDIAGNTILKACSSIEKYDSGKASLSTWVGRIAINCTKDALDYHMKRKPVSGSLEVSCETDGEEYNAADKQLCSKEFERCFQEKVAKLSERNRKYVRMLDEGYKPKDMAILDNCSPNAAAKRVFDIRRQLKKDIAGLASEYEICLDGLAG